MLLVVCYVVFCVVRCCYALLCVVRCYSVAAEVLVALVCLCCECVLSVFSGVCSLLFLLCCCVLVLLFPLYYCVCFHCCFVFRAVGCFVACLLGWVVVCGRVSDLCLRVLHVSRVCQVPLRCFVPSAVLSLASMGGHRTFVPVSPCVPLLSGGGLYACVWFVVVCGCERFVL